jgi:Ca2+-binding EF-hand superfamily protein
MRRAGQVPDITAQPRMWFQFWDEDDGGTLCKNEVLRAIVKTFRIADNSVARTAAIFGSLDAMWPIFDTDGSGEIDINEFTETDGLCDSLVASLHFET